VQTHHGMTEGESNDVPVQQRPAGFQLLSLERVLDARSRAVASRDDKMSEFSGRLYGMRDWRRKNCDLYWFSQMILWGSNQGIILGDKKGGLVANIVDVIILPNLAPLFLEFC